ncbi:MFS transporter [Chloroflexota bacterium]
MVIIKKLSPYHGWLVVYALTLVMIGAYGTLLSFGVFLKPILSEFGGTRAIASGAMSTVQATSGLVGIIVGRLTDKYGARVLLAVGALSGGSGYLLMSQSSSLWHLYSYFGIMVGIFIGSCWTPVNATVSKWFTRRRALALGITNSGLMVGQMIVPPLAAFVTVSSGWRPAYIMLAFIVWIALVPAILILGKNPPRDTNTRPVSISDKSSMQDKFKNLIPEKELTTAEAVKTSPFWMLMITGLVTATSFYLISTHVVAYATDKGIAATPAATILTLISVGSIVGNILIGNASSRLGSSLPLFLMLAMQAVALFLLIFANSLWILFALGFFFGLGFGGSVIIRMSMISEFFGQKAIGSIIGIVAVGWSVGAIIGPFAAGLIFDLNGSYTIAFLVGGFLMVLGMSAIYLLKTDTKVFG